MGKRKYVFSSTDLEIIRKYFKVSIIEEEEEEPYIVIHGEGNSFDSICIYNGEKGRVIAVIETETEHADYLLFSPTGELESSALTPSYMIMGDSIEFLIKKVVKTIFDFRIKLPKKLYSCKKIFNFNFRTACGVKFDFFYCYEGIININPICNSEKEFKNMIIDLYQVFEKFNKEGAEKFLEEDLKDLKSLKVLEKIFMKIGKGNEVKSEINALKSILGIRNTYVHGANRFFTDFLRDFGIQCPTKCQEYCDLSIFIMERCIEIVDKMSEILKRSI